LLTVTLSVLACSGASLNSAPAEPTAPRDGSPAAATSAETHTLAPSASPAAPSSSATEKPNPAATPSLGAVAGHSATATAYSTPLLDEAALSRAIIDTCQAALAAKRPVLVEFSAPWCEDCLVLEKLKQEPALAQELSHWQLLVINVGDGDAHPDLMRAFQVRAIAKLVVLSPGNCRAPIASWPRGPARILDGLRKRSGGAGQELASWLMSVRGPR